MYKHFFKRFIDVVLAFIGVVVLALPMLIIALVIKLDSRGPAFFKQVRLGLNGKEFTLLKFRSMCVNAEAQGSGVYSEKGDARVTRIGKIIRATSLDELPQLINILRGDMSFIGERGIIEATKKNIDFSRVVAVNSVSL